jgi:hypothetical protein
MRPILTTGFVVAAAAALGAQGQDRAADVLQQMRQALGGDKLTRAKAVSLQGPFRREAGDLEIGGTTELVLQLPDRMYRSEETEMPGGALTVERVSVLAGDRAWDDIQTRGGVGGPPGGVFLFRGPQGQELNPEALEQARVRRGRIELTRYQLAVLGGAGLQPAYAGVAESPDGGKADVLEVPDPTGQAIRLFVDQETHLPLMLQYQDIRPRMLFGGRGFGLRGRGAFGGVGPEGRGAAPPAAGSEGETPGAAPQGGAGGATRDRPSPEEIRRRMEEAGLQLTPTTITLFLADYQKVDGVMLPHRLTASADGKPFEEWSIEKAKVNPPLKADLFEKK